MAFVVLTCPYCQAERMAMHIYFALPQPAGINGMRPTVEAASCGMCCPNCYRTVGAEIYALSHETSAPFGSSIDLASQQGNPTLHGWTVREVWPGAKTHVAPDNVPSRVAEVFIEGEEARARGQVHAAGLLYGKTLDIAVRRFNPALQGTLHARIKALGDTNEIPKSLAEWLMGLKLIRNDATHEEDPLSLEDIDHVAEATRLILEYLFSMPERIQALTAAQPVTNP